MAQESAATVKKRHKTSHQVVKVKRKPTGKLKRSKFPCDQCKKILSSAAHLKKHINTTHCVKDFICDYDGKHFNSKDKLRLHIYIHRKHYRVQCGVQGCNKEYTTNQSMRKHLRTHFESFMCHECGKTFKHKRLLLNHNAALHYSGEPSIPCKCMYVLLSRGYDVIESFYSIQIAQGFSPTQRQETLIRKTFTRTSRSTLGFSFATFALWALR